MGLRMTTRNSVGHESSKPCHVDLGARVKERMKERHVHFLMRNQTRKMRDLLNTRRYLFHPWFPHQTQSLHLLRKVDYHREGIQKKRMTSPKSPSGPKGCPNGCDQSGCQQVSLHRHQLLKSLLQPQTMVSFVSVLMHCEPCRIQPINRWLLRSLCWLMNTVPLCRKKCPWLDGSSSRTSRSRKRSVRWIRWRLRMEICPQSIQHLQTMLQNTSKLVQDAKTELAQFQTERSEVV